MDLQQHRSIFVNSLEKLSNPRYIFLSLLLRPPPCRLKLQTQVSQVLVLRELGHLFLRGGCRHRRRRVQAFLSVSCICHSNNIVGAQLPTEVIDVARGRRRRGAAWRKSGITSRSRDSGRGRRRRRRSATCAPSLA